MRREYTAYLQSKNFTKTGISSRIYQIERYIKWLNKKPVQANKKDLLDYINYLREKQNLSSQTIQIYLKNLEHYYTLLLSQNKITSNPTALIKLRGTKRKYLPKILTLEEINEFIDLYYHSEVRNNPSNQEFYIILTLAAYQGINLHEWKALKAKDIDLQKGTIYIESRRKSNARTLALQASQIGVLYPFVQSKQADDYLISLPLSSTYKWTKQLKKLYPKFIDFRQLRASIITYWIQTEGLRKAQYKAGHRYISSTEKFIANDLDSLTQDISQFHPL